MTINSPVIPFFTCSVIPNPVGNPWGAGGGGGFYPPLVHNLTCWETYDHDFTSRYLAIYIYIIARSWAVTQDIVGIHGYWHRHTITVPEIRNGDQLLILHLFLIP